MKATPQLAGPTTLKADSYWSKMAIHRVPSKYLLISAFISYMILAISYLEGAPPWIAFGLALLPWCLMVMFELQWSYKHFHWFALFGLMAFVQTIHYSEHCIEIIQVHIFHEPVYKAIAIFSTLNIEWVHFLGDTFLTIGTLVLVSKFPRNPWLWVAIPFQIAHQAEHTFLIFNYLFEGARAGGPGLLSSPGGAIGGGVGLNRPDLHWIYNTLYTIPFVLALIYQLKRTYDEALDEAFPEAPKAELLEASRRLETFHYAVSETVLAPGDDADRLYIIVEGEAVVFRHDDDGQVVEVATLHKGQYFGEVGLLVPGAPHTKTIRAKTDLTVLAMDEPTFRHLMDTSQATHDRFAEMAADRVVHLPDARTSEDNEQVPALVGATSAPRATSRGSARASGARSGTRGNGGASAPRTRANGNGAQRSGATAARGKAAAPKPAPRKRAGDKS